MGAGHAETFTLADHRTEPLTRRGPRMSIAQKIHDLTLSFHDAPSRLIMMAAQAVKSEAANKKLMGRTRFPIGRHRSHEMDRGTHPTPGSGAKKL